MAKITKEMIARILAHAGGAANVAQAGNCMTRLRLTLRDEGPPTPPPYARLTA